MKICIIGGTTEQASTVASMVASGLISQGIHATMEDREQDHQDSDFIATQMDRIKTLVDQEFSVNVIVEQ